MNNKVIFDGRNVYDPEEMKELEYTYYSIGRATVHANQNTNASKKISA